MRVDTSFLARPASDNASLTASPASSLLDESESLPNLVCPTPTMATLIEFARVAPLTRNQVTYLVSLKKANKLHITYTRNRIEPSALIVSDEPAKHRILGALADEYSRKILSATIEDPMSALELSKKYEIPITTVYRRIEELVQAGLLAAVKSGRTTDGKWYDLYRSLLRTIGVSFEKGVVRIEVTINENVADNRGFERLAWRKTRAGLLHSENLVEHQT